MSTRLPELLTPFAVTTLAPRLEAKGRYRGTSVLKLSGNTWPDGALSERLSRLPFSVRVRVDPESLW